jgi:hypothetical protein
LLTYAYPPLIWATRDESNQIGSKRWVKKRKVLHLLGGATTREPGTTADPLDARI